jgi:hypothetical protein
MSGGSYGPLHVPDGFWQRPDVVAALARRDIGALFRILAQRTGASQMRIGTATGNAQPRVSAIVNGRYQVKTLEHLTRIADGLGMPAGARIVLGLAPAPDTDSPAATQGVAASPASLAPADAPQAGADRGPGGEACRDDDQVRRRTFVGLTGTMALKAVLDVASPPGRLVDIGPLTLLLADHTGDSAAIDGPPDLAALAAAADAARRLYQACCYSALTAHLPDLIARLEAACQSQGGDDRLRALALVAETYHVAAGMLLKLDDPSLACLAADRSMRAAVASEDPLMVGGSARIVTHTLMNTGHAGAAVATASSHASRLTSDPGRGTPEAISVYGSLVLRGAIAAAQHGDRGTAFELLGEADDAGRQLGSDRNLRWTAFGPVNAAMHRVNVAVTLGDAGTALDVARHIDLEAITVTERKANLFLDAARALLQLGRHEQSYSALRAAEMTAPEEIAARPSARRLVADLVISCPPSLRAEARQFAARVGPAS